MKLFINGIHLHVFEQGNGPLTLVFLHYFGGSALEWQSIMNRLSDRHRCVAVDLRGHGDSEAPTAGKSTPGGYFVDDMADDVLGLVDELAIQDFVLIGHSMSGKVALAVAAGTPNHPQPTGLRLLLLVSPSPPLPEPIPDGERQKLVNGYGQREAAETLLKNSTAVAVSEAVREQIIADNLRTAKSAWMAWLTSGSREDISARMSAVNVPIHIIVGSEDRALPPDVQNRLVLPFLKNVTLTIIETVGHLLPWEIPDELGDFILNQTLALEPDQDKF
ncbi:MAG: alpha/beta hydrolase [Cytophagaceae bacterium]|nr:alpha/beta hydrolase [Cytophagaceae bacterium]